MLGVLEQRRLLIEVVAHADMYSIAREMVVEAKQTGMQLLSAHSRKTKCESASTVMFARPKEVGSAFRVLSPLLCGIAPDPICRYLSIYSVDDNVTLRLAVPIAQAPSLPSRPAW